MRTPSPADRAVPTERLTYSIPEAARALGIGETLARRMILDRELPAVRLGARLVVPRAAVHRLLAARPQDGEPGDRPAIEGERDDRRDGRDARRGEGER